MSDIDPTATATVAGNGAQTPKVRKQRTKAAKTEGQAHDNAATGEPGQGNGNGVAYALVEDVDQGPDLGTTKLEEPARKYRFDIAADALGPEQPVVEEPAQSFTIDFGPPGPMDWFRIDPRPGRELSVTFVKAKPKGATRDKLYYVAITARGIPEIAPYIRGYTLHVIQKRVGLKVMTALWARRQATTHASGMQDTWGATDAKVAKLAAAQWIRREVDPNASSGYRAVLRPTTPGIRRISRRRLLLKRCAEN